MIFFAPLSNFKSKKRSIKKGRCQIFSASRFLGDSKFFSSCPILCSIKADTNTGKGEFYCIDSILMKKTRRRKRIESNLVPSHVHVTCNKLSGIKLNESISSNTHFYAVLDSQPNHRKIFFNVQYVISCLYTLLHAQSCCSALSGAPPPY